MGLKRKKTLPVTLIIFVVNTSLSLSDVNTLLSIRDVLQAFPKHNFSVLQYMHHFLSF